MKQKKTLCGDNVRPSVGAEYQRLTACQICMKSGVVCVYKTL